MQEPFLSNIELNIHRLNDIRHRELLTTETPVPGTSAFEVELAIEKLKGHKSPGIDQIPPEFINTLRTGDTDLHLYITTVQDG